MRVYLFVCLFVWLPVCEYMCLFVCLFVWLAASVYEYICLFVCLVGLASVFVCLFVCLGGLLLLMSIFVCFVCPAGTQDTLPTGRQSTTPRMRIPDACTALVAARGPREPPPGHGPPVTTPIWTADLNSRCRRGFKFQQPPNLQAGGGPPRVTPTGPLGGDAAGQHPPALRGICTPPLF